MNEKYSARPRNPLDRRIDFEERPALRRSRVGGERADTEADDRDLATVDHPRQRVPRLPERSRLVEVGQRLAAALRRQRLHAVERGPVREPVVAAGQILADAVDAKERARRIEDALAGIAEARLASISAAMQDPKRIGCRRCVNVMQRRHRERRQLNARAIRGT